MYQLNAHEVFEILRKSVPQLLYATLFCAPPIDALYADSIADEVGPASEIVEPAEVEATTISADPGKTAASSDEDKKKPAVDLLEGELDKHWEHFSSKEGVSLSDVWKVRVQDNRRVLVCQGDPKGFLYSKESFTDFELTFEWKYSKDPDGNSGVLVFTQNEPRLWPTSIQVQLHQPNAGAVFPSGDAKSDNSTDPNEPPLALPVGEWNKCHIIGGGGRMWVRINDRIAGEVSGCDPAVGRIAIQSEGSETHFRNMQIRVLDKSELKSARSPDETPPTETAEKSATDEAEKQTDAGR